MEMKVQELCLRDKVIEDQCEDEMWKHEEICRLKRKTERHEVTGRSEARWSLNRMKNDCPFHLVTQLQVPCVKHRILLL